jgi:hypothetical protein
MSVFNYGSPGLGHAGSYQVSGKPYLSGGINVSTATMAGVGPLEISFPSVTRWVIVTNHDTSNDVDVAFSEKGFGSNNFFTVSSDTNDRANMMTQRMELKVTSIFLSGSSTKVDVIAGLTGIANTELRGNWTGSAGVG